MWLVLEDNARRIEGFCQAASQSPLKPELRHWRNASQMIVAIPALLGAARLISLDHDLYKYDNAEPDPGSGREVANFLATLPPACPVIVHSTNTDAAWGMYNQLTAAAWAVHLVHHLDEPDWIVGRWLPLAERLVSAHE